MAMQDPIQKVLEDLGKFRGQVNTQLMRLPVPDPARDTLQRVDRGLSELERNIRTHMASFPSVEAQRVIKTGPQAWARALSQAQVWHEWRDKWREQRFGR